jgi:twitching motility two-component system response regulator PilH
MNSRRHPNPLVRPLVLIVEAHEDTRALYALSLSMMGFDVVPAQDGAEGYRRALQIHPDVIVTDLPLPNRDRSQFLQDLRESACTRDIPVVVVSGEVQASESTGAERDGFAAFLPKPCPPVVLAAALRHVLDP